MGKAKYTKGLYNYYDKNHKERNKEDYYATPPKEVRNILKTLKINDLNKSTILEPSCGGGHMAEAIASYLYDNYDSKNWKLYATDLHYHDSVLRDCDWKYGEKYDFLGDNYPIVENIDYIIMNPPYATIEPFTIRALEIAKKGILMLARLQFLEGKNRYENILKNNPPSDVYVYIDRIKCYKDGDFSIKGSSAQAYAWFYWDKTKKNASPQIHWIHRVDE